MFGVGRSMFDVQAFNYSQDVKFHTRCQQRCWPQSIQFDRKIYFWNPENNLMIGWERFLTVLRAEACHENEKNISIQTMADFLAYINFHLPCFGSFGRRLAHGHAGGGRSFTRTIGFNR